MTIITTIAVPERTAQQRLDALAIANDIRSRRAQLKRDITVGRVNVAALIAAPPDWADTMLVHDVLLALPRIGRVKVGTILKRHAVSPSKTLGGLSQRQRTAIHAELIARRRA